MPKEIRTKKTIRIIKDKDLTELLNDKKFRNEVTYFFKSDYLTAGLVRYMYPGIDDNTAHNKKDSKTTKNQIIKKLEKIFAKANDNLIEIVKEYNEIIDSLKNRDGYYYDKLFNKIWEVKDFAYALDVERYIEDYNIIDEIIRYFPINDMIVIFNSDFDLEINNSYSEFVVATTRASISEYKEILDFNNKITIEAVRMSSSRI